MIFTGRLLAASYVVKASVEAGGRTLWSLLQPSCKDHSRG